MLILSAVLFDLRESALSVGEEVFASLLLSVASGGFFWYYQRRRDRSRTVDRAVAARISSDELLEGIPWRVKKAVHDRIKPATEEGTRLIETYGRAEPEAEAEAAARATRVVDNTIAQVLRLYWESGRLGRLFFTIGLPAVFKSCFEHHLHADLDRHEAARFVPRQAFRSVF